MFSLGRTLSDGIPNRRQDGAIGALRTLGFINLINYADRIIISVCKLQIEDDLNLDDFEVTIPHLGMAIAFTIAAAVFGWIVDKNTFDRRILLSGGIVFWSLSTGLAGISRNLVELTIFRSLVGVGEACYGTIAPPMLFDFFPKWDRSVSYSIYFLAMPVGSALGFGIGAVIASIFGWRWAFAAFGVPGLIASFYALKLNNPMRGINDPELHENEKTLKLQDVSVTNPIANIDNANGGADSSDLNKQTQKEDVMENQKKEDDFDEIEIEYRSSSVAEFNETDGQKAYREIKSILTNPIFLLCTLGLSAQTFALAGFADWATAFLQRYESVSLKGAGLLVGSFTVVGGIAGMIGGMKVVIHYDSKIKNVYFLLPALYAAATTIFLIIGLNTTQYRVLSLTLFFFFEVFAFASIGPITTLAISTVAPNMRSRASGLILFIQHCLGSIISPPIIGLISSVTGSLKTGLQATWMATALTCCYWMYGYYALPPFPVMEDLKRKADEQERLRIVAEREELNRKGLGSDHLAETQHNATGLPVLSYNEVLCACCMKKEMPMASI